MAGEAHKFKLKMDEVHHVRLEGPDEGPLIGFVVHDVGPTTGEYKRPFKDFPYHAVLGSKIVGSDETHEAALRRLFEAWVDQRMAKELP